MDVFAVMVQPIWAEPFITYLLSTVQHTNYSHRNNHDASKDNTDNFIAWRPNHMDQDTANQAN